MDGGDDWNDGGGANDDEEDRASSFVALDDGKEAPGKKPVSKGHTDRVHKDAKTILSGQSRLSQAGVPLDQLVPIISSPLSSAISSFPSTIFFRHFLSLFHRFLPPFSAFLR
jgi:hypothetical protein